MYIFTCIPRGEYFTDHEDEHGEWPRAKNDLFYALRGGFHKATSSRTSI